MNGNAESYTFLQVFSLGIQADIPWEERRLQPWSTYVDYGKINISINKW